MRIELPFKEISGGAAEWPLGIALVDLRTNLFCSRRYSTEKGMSALLASKISFIYQRRERVRDRNIKRKTVISAETLQALSTSSS